MRYDIDESMRLIHIRSREIIYRKKRRNIYYLATLANGKPRVRPFGTAEVFEGKLYIQTLINAIEKENDNNTCQKMFSNLKKVIDNSGMILEKNELNELFNKIMKIFENLEKKRLNLISKKDKKNIKKNLQMMIQMMKI